MTEAVSNHVHRFEPKEWPFQEASNTVAFTNHRVLRENHPVLLVSHDHEGDWQFLCGGEDPGECLIVCLGCAFENDKTVGLVADLPAGWIAWRSSVTERWQREPREEEPQLGPTIGSSRRPCRRFAPADPRVNVSVRAHKCAAP